MSEEAIMDMSKAITDVFTGISGTQKMLLLISYPLIHWKDT